MTTRCVLSPEICCWLKRLLLIGGLVPARMQAGGIELVLQAPRQAGMGHTGTAFAADASVMVLNPGLLGATPRPGVIFGGWGQRSTTRFLAQTPGDYTAETQPFTLAPICLYVSMRRGNSRWTWGLGAHTPYLSYTRWPDQWKGQYISREFSFTTLALRPSVGVRLSPRWYVGLSGILLWGNMTHQRALQIDGPNGVESLASFDGTGGGAGIQAGVYYRASGRLALGLSGQSQTRLRIDQGLVRFTVPESLIPLYPDLNFTSELPLPAKIQAGLHYQPDQRFSLTLDLVYTRWSTWDTLTFSLSRVVKGLAEFPEVLYHNTLSFRTGCEYAFTDRIAFRGGAYSDPSPVTQEYVSPALPDANKIGITVGAGYQVTDHLQADICFQWENTGERTALLRAANFAGTYITRAYAAGISIKYLW
ncbi:MAG: outer membrane protein transport protein [Bacteroidia bacterium]|nr:outer membrane protein transport protein [Bacteroidia bacterium]